MALLRFIENPRDRVAGFRLMQLMPGVGPTSAQRVIDFIMAVADPISEIANAPVPPRVGSEDWSAFVATIGDLRAGRAGWPAELERARLWYEPHLDRIHEDAVVPAFGFDPAGTDRFRLSLPGTLSYRAYA